MRQLDDIGIRLCEFQADLFELSTSNVPCSSLVFVKQFMSSNIACRMDKGTYVFEALDTPGCLEELSKEKKLTQGTEKYPAHIMSWIGYMYRFIAFTREIPSAYLFSKLKTKQLYLVYEAYHSLDPEAAATRLLETVDILTDSPQDRLALARKILLET